MISKQEASPVLSRSDKAHVAELEVQIDQHISDTYDGTRIFVYPKTWPLARVQAEIKRIYEEGGWKVSFNEDQRDGNWIKLE